MSTQRNGLIPLSRVVGSAIVDTYSDVGRSEHLFYHWAARGLRKLVTESINFPPKRVLLPVNPNTMTVTLPIDFEEELFIGYIKNGERVPIYVNPDLINLSVIEEIECTEKCKKCGNKPICEEFNVVRDKVMHDFFGTNYAETIVRKISSDGSYWEYRNIPYVDFEDGNIIKYRDEKIFIAAIDLTDCGCVENTIKNQDTIKTCCPDVYNCYFTSRNVCCSSSSALYNIFEEAGLIQIDNKFKEDKLYMEYRGFIPKINGEYHVPAVTFEPLVSWIKFMAIDGKSNIPRGDKDWRLQRYKDDAANMRKILGRVKLSSIINSASKIPTFDIHG